MQPNRNKKKVIPFTLALGGGGARGFAHIGVLKALEKIDLIPSLIVGTSMGAVIGGMYSQLHNAEAIEEKLKIFLEGDFYKRIGLEQFSDTDRKSTHSVWERFAAHLRQRYFLSRSVFGNGTFAQITLLQALNMLLDKGDIRDGSPRFAAVTSDLVDGKEHVITSGSIITAVAASSAVPGVIAPFEVDSHLFIDGTVTSTIPVPAASSLSKDPIIAVDVRRSLGNFENFQRGYEIVIRASEVTTRKLNDLHLQNADIILKPDVKEIDWNEFHHINQCINAGERAVEQNLQQLTDKLIKHPFRFFPW
jgi:NTE family protein